MCPRFSIIDRALGLHNTLKENAEALVAVTREIRLEVSAEKLSTWSCLEIRMQDEFRM